VAKAFGNIFFKSWSIFLNFGHVSSLGGGGEGRSTKSNRNCHLCHFVVKALSPSKGLVHTHTLSQLRESLLFANTRVGGDVCVSIQQQYNGDM
jgi:hypothetical protein